MKRVAIRAVHAAQIDQAGEAGLLDVTFEGGARGVLRVSYEAIGLAVQALLVSNQLALIARTDAGTIDALAHMQRFTLESVTVDGLTNHVGLGLMLRGGGVMPVAIPRALAREFGERLIAAADRPETPGPARH